MRLLRKGEQTVIGRAGGGERAIPDDVEIE
jgi:hypothetical protein